MQYWKMNGAGNDFIIVNNFDGSYDGYDWPAIAKKLCERHLSVGADGLMVVEKPQSAETDFKMLFYNSNGAPGEMCGNGARCICRFGYENSLASDVQKVETPAGVVVGQRLSGRNYKIRLNDVTKIETGRIAVIGDEKYEYAYVELGDPGLPHAVVCVKGLRDYPKDKLFELGRKFRYYEGFPKGANINFYDVTGKDEIYEMTYERFVEDFTYACGTGAGSAALVLTVKGEVSGSGVIVNVKGGQLKVDIVRQGEKVTDIYLTGPTNIVAKGEATDEDLFREELQ